MQMKIVTLDTIKDVLSGIDPLPIIEEGFVKYSAGDAVVPPVGELLLDKGEVHIKYGFIRGGDYYVIKIASGFYDNPRIGLPSSGGLMLVFSQETGEPMAALLDGGYLTDIRTAIAGAIAAKYLAPSKIKRIGIVGAGTQGRLQLRYLAGVTECRDVLIWDRSQRNLDSYIEELNADGYQVQAAESTAELLRSCSLIVTATPSSEPLLMVEELRSGTHITAVGSDTPHKQELDAQILARADIVVADSISQCLVRGEIHQALKAGVISQEKILELGNVIAGAAPRRTDDSQITVADLTGVAVQDIGIALSVLENLSRG
jgi:ornithine cyclodeaminase